MLARLSSCSSLVVNPLWTPAQTSTLMVSRSREFITSSIWGFGSRTISPGASTLSLLAVKLEGSLVTSIVCFLPTALWKPSYTCINVRCCPSLSMAALSGILIWKRINCYWKTFRNLLWKLPQNLGTPPPITLYTSHLFLPVDSTLNYSTCTRF